MSRNKENAIQITKNVLNFEDSNISQNNDMSGLVFI